MKIRAIVLSFIVVLTGCASSLEDDRRRFKDRLDYQVGRPIIPDIYASARIIDTDDPAIKNYVFKNPNGCEVMQVVELQTIKSWKYLSDPDLCVTKIGWGGPF